MGIIHPLLPTPIFLQIQSRTNKTWHNMGFTIPELKRACLLQKLLRPFISIQEWLNLRTTRLLLLIPHTIRFLHHHQIQQPHMLKLGSIPAEVSVRFVESNLTVCYSIAVKWVCKNGYRGSLSQPNSFFFLLMKFFPIHICPRDFPFP